MKKLRVAINGFGRIGRNVLRAFLHHHDEFDDFEIVAINDVAPPKTLLHLFKYDSTHGRLSAFEMTAKIATMADEHWLVIERGEQQFSVALFAQSDPKNLPWGQLKVDVVLECTGQFREYERASWHRQAGAKQVIIGAAPFDEIDASIVVGVNENILHRRLPIVSGVSCTTQAIVPLLSVLDETFGLTSAMMTEIHAVTADQAVLDAAHRDLRRARAAGHNIIPTTSSSIAASVRVLPQMAGKIGGHSIRVPTINVAAIDVVFVFARSANIKEVLATLKQASQGSLHTIMGYSDEPLVSSDFVGNRHSLVIDELQCEQVGEQIKIFAWYDNEWGYANRLLDMCKKLAKS